MDASQLTALYDWFERFTAGFRGETSDEQRNYDLKVEHTYRVCAHMRRLAAAEGLVPDEQRLAEAVALCHDVGRFPQYRQYRTFNDPVSANHAALAVQTLKEQQVLASLPSLVAEQILAAVALHNVFQLPDGLPSAVHRLALLIRDADKLDIWRVLIEYCTTAAEERASAVVWELPDTGRCSERALGEIIAGRMIDRTILETADDFKLLQLSWAYDLNFCESFTILAEMDYIATLAVLLPKQPGSAEAVATVCTYIANRQETRRLCHA